MTELTHHVMQADSVEQNEEETRPVTIRLGDDGLRIMLGDGADCPRVYIEWQEGRWTLYVHADDSERNTTINVSDEGRIEINDPSGT